MLHIPALWYFGTSVTYPPWFRRVNLVVIPPRFILQQYLWNIAIQPAVGCYNSWANLRSSGCYPLGEKWLWNRSIGQVLIRDIIRSGIAIHTAYAPHLCNPYAIDTQIIRNTCEIVAPEMFHQTISAILLRICSFLRTPYERRGLAGQWNKGQWCGVLMFSLICA